jgi:hypothetical protein
MRLTAQDEKRPSYHSLRHDAHYTTSSSFSNQPSKEAGVLPLIKSYHV